MRRREFITLAGGVVATWPLVARAQQDRVWRVAVLLASSETDKGGVAIFDAFRRKLQDLGYVEGRNLRLDVRRAEGDFTRLPGLAAELVSLVPDVIVGSGQLSIAAAQGATRSIPIVMATIAVDPIGSGFIKSFAKPGGNITPGCII